MVYTKSRIGRATTIKIEEQIPNPKKKGPIGPFGFRNTFGLELAEDAANLVHERFVGKIDVLDLGELFQKFSLFLG